MYVVVTFLDTVIGNSSPLVSKSLSCKISDAFAIFTKTILLVSFTTLIVKVGLE